MLSARFMRIILYRHWHSNGRIQAAQDANNNIRYSVRIRIFYFSPELSNTWHQSIWADIAVGEFSVRSLAAHRKSKVSIQSCGKVKRILLQKSPPAIEIDTHVLRINSRTTPMGQRRRRQRYDFFMLFCVVKHKFVGQIEWAWASHLFSTSFFFSYSVLPFSMLSYVAWFVCFPLRG